MGVSEETSLFLASVFHCVAYPRWHPRTMRRSTGCKERAFLLVSDMKSSCISHNKSEPILIIRQSYVKACNGDHCAAALMSFFEYWHNIKIDMQSKAEHANATARKFGDEGQQDTTLFQFHTSEELADGLLGLFGERKIREGIDVLKELGIISVHRNPNPRYKFDNTRFFLFSPEVSEMRISSGKNAGRCGKNAGLSGKNAGTITETSSETSSERKAGDSRPAATDGQAYLDRVTSHERANQSVTMTTDWKPGEQFPALMMRAGMKSDRLTDEILAKFVIHHNGTCKPQGKWEAALVTWCKREQANAPKNGLSGGQSGTNEPQRHPLAFTDEKDRPKYGTYALMKPEPVKIANDPNDPVWIKRKAKLLGMIK